MSKEQQLQHRIESECKRQAQQVTYVRWTQNVEKKFLGWFQVTESTEPSERWASITFDWRSASLCMWFLVALRCALFHPIMF
jgi:hypothetical protein